MAYSPDRRSILFVAAADRGHFQWALPLAQHLAVNDATRESEQCFQFELWTHEISAHWLHQETSKAQSGAENATVAEEEPKIVAPLQVPLLPHLMPSVEEQLPVLEVKPYLGHGQALQGVVSAYKSAVGSMGDTDAEGQAAALSNDFEGLWAAHAKRNLPQNFAFHKEACATERGRTLFEQRLIEGNVAAVVWERVWCSWVPALCAKFNVPNLGLNPSYIGVFRDCLKVPCWGFDCTLTIRSSEEECNSIPGIGAKWSEMGYILAKILRGDTAPPQGRFAFGPFFPPMRIMQAPNGGLEELLAKWLDGNHIPSSQRPVTLVAMGSHSLLSSISPRAENDVVQGCLRASPRVLLVSNAESDDLDAIQQDERILVWTKWLPQKEVLAHENTRAFVSHGGANSVHEALFHQVAVVPLPFFDDQWYIAESLEGSAVFGYHDLAKSLGPITTEAREDKTEMTFVPLRKEELRDGRGIEVTEAAVRLALAVSDETRQSLRKEILQEDGARAASEVVRKLVAKGNSASSEALVPG